MVTSKSGRACVGVRVMYGWCMAWCLCILPGFGDVGLGGWEWSGWYHVKWKNI